MSRSHPLAALFGDDAEDDRPARKTPPDVLCITLKEVAERYGKPCPFKPGDLVTPRKGYNTPGEGDPHVVMQVLPEPVQSFDVTDSVSSISNGYGRRIDIRVVCESKNGTVSAYWSESWEFEPYTGPVASLDDEAA